MKRMIILFAAAFMMAAIFPISAGAGDNGTTLTANLLDLWVSGKSSPPGTKFYVSYRMMPPSDIDSLEIRYEKTGNYTQFVTQVLKGPQPLLSPATIPVLRGGPTLTTFFVDIPFGDTNSILLSVYYKGQPIDSMGMSFYREGDSVIFSRRTFPRPPKPPRNSEYEMEGDVAYMPFGPSLEIISKPYLYGMMSFQLTVLLNYPYDSLIITAIPVGKLVFENSDRWIIHPSDAAKVTIPIDVSIPPDDTSGFQIKIADEKGPKNGIWRHFVTTGDTLEIYYFKPEPREETRGQLYITPAGGLQL